MRQLVDVDEVRKRDSSYTGCMIAGTAEHDAAEG
jgi:hypothetical protein